MAKLIPVDHDPFVTEPQGPWGNVGAAMPEAYGGGAPIQDVLARSIMSVATLPKRLGDAVMESNAHTFGPGRSTMTTDELPWDQRDPLPGISAEAAMMTMGGAGVVPAEGNTLRAGMKLAGSIPAELNTLRSGMKLRTTYWGGESGRAYSHTPVLFKEIPHTPGKGAKFGIAEDGTPWIESSFMPQDKHLGRAIQEYLAPLKDDEYIRTAWNTDDYNHLQNGTHLGSMNHATGAPEAGLSVAKHLEFPQKYAYKVTGKKIGTGSDSEPILETSSAKPIGPLLPYSKMAKKFEADQRKKIASLGLSPEQAKALQTTTVPMKPEQYEKYVASGNHEVLGDTPATPTPELIPVDHDPFR